jgi:starch phosphorylase
MLLTNAPLDASWCSKQDLPISPKRPVAYISAEIGMFLTQASGGLGHLAADIVRAAAELGTDMVGVTLWYRRGYFKQLIVDGHQEEEYPLHDPAQEGLQLIPDVRVRVELRPGEFITAQIWEHRVSDRVRLFLLDTDVEENPVELRTLALYGGDAHQRLAQELLLGMGGVQALELLGLDPPLYHLNEGHASFGILPLLERHIRQGQSPVRARQLVREQTLFTTHTPVPAGIRRYPIDMMQEYFGYRILASGMSLAEFLALGKFPGDDWNCFNQAAWALNMSGDTNGVSELHAEVSNEMFASLNLERPIKHVLNGVHLPTWTGPNMAEVFRTWIGEDWARCPEELWEPLRNVPPEVLWHATCEGRIRLINGVRRLPGEENSLDENRLTIGFARRVPTYKQLTLMLEYPDSLRKLLEEDGVQFVFAGKAHPEDEPGKRLIEHLLAFINDPAHAHIRRYIVFIPDYDAEIAKLMVAGCDIWLNHPIFGEEASGTSGMKAALNGGRNFSVPDGWCYSLIRHGFNGWSIGEKRKMERPELARSLYHVLHAEILPLWQARDFDGIPARWVSTMVDSIISLVWQVSSLRMMVDYVELYRSVLARKPEYANTTQG